MECGGKTPLLDGVPRLRDRLVQMRGLSAPSPMAFGLNTATTPAGARRAAACIRSVAFIRRLV